MHLGACLQSDPGPRLLPTALGALAEAGGLRVLSRTLLSGKPGDSVGQQEWRRRLCPWGLPGALLFPSEGLGRWPREPSRSSR